MRYFKWGVSRLILEPVECPDVVPIFIEGTDQIMHESRTFPRFIPRIGKQVTVTFGEPVNVEAVFGDLRSRWRELEHEEKQQLTGRDWDERWLGLKFILTHEQVELMKECTRRVREEVLKVRRSRGLKEEDPKCGLVETWVKEGPKREGLMDDGTWVKDT